ncbi:MAG TPA: type II secretion system F family protein [Smithellaceae bacterium]|nr:type II secretion system F family protein [Smithellaceae bacterium]
MAFYAYRATTHDGQIQEGQIEAQDEKSAIERLKNAGVILIKITAQKKAKNKSGARTSKDELQTFTAELYVLLNAGLPLDRSLNILSDVFESKGMKSVIESILTAIRGGKTFSDALLEHPKIFPRLYVNMIKAGEASGVLDVILEKLNEFLESTKELKDNVFSAMIYPVILLVTSILSIIMLLIFVVPRFSSLFNEMGGSLPPTTQMLMSMSTGLQNYWWALLLIIAALIFTFRAWIMSASGKYKWDALKLKLLGDVIVKLEIARFCRTLGTLLKSGVPLLQALINSRDVTTNLVISEALEKIMKEAKEGKGIAVPLANTGIFPPLALSMIKVGEETGQMEDMLIKVAVTYEKSLKETIKRFVSLLGPIMILVLALIIGFIVVSMLLAIFSITDMPF